MLLVAQTFLYKYKIHSNAKNEHKVHASQPLLCDGAFAISIEFQNVVANNL
jgi:hypothetical protein